MAKLEFAHHIYNARKHHHRGLVFLFPALGTRLWMYRPLIHCLTREGYSVIGYDYQARRMLKGGDVENALKESFRMLDDAQSLLDKRKDTFVAAIGASMGSYFALRLAKNNPGRIKKLVIAVPYGTLANNVWTWKYFKSVKKQLIKQGYTEESLFEALKPIETTWELEKLPSKSILLMDASNDRVQKNTAYFGKQAKQKDRLHTHHTNKAGHYLGGTWHMLKHKRIVDFLKS